MEDPKLVARADGSLWRKSRSLDSGEGSPGATRHAGNTAATTPRRVRPNTSPKKSKSHSPERARVGIAGVYKGEVEQAISAMESRLQSGRTRRARPGQDPSPREAAAAALQRSLLPPGILPLDEIEEFQLDDQQFVLKIKKPLLRHLSHCRVHYATTVTGTLQHGMLARLKGIEIEDTLLRIPVRMPVRSVHIRGLGLERVGLKTGILTKEHSIVCTALAT